MRASGDCRGRDAHARQPRPPHMLPGPTLSVRPAAMRDAGPATNATNPTNQPNRLSPPSVRSGSGLLECAWRRHPKTSRFFEGPRVSEPRWFCTAARRSSRRPRFWFCWITEVCACACPRAERAVSCLPMAK
jgi:hypothetical protein